MTQTADTSKRNFAPLLVLAAALCFSTGGVLIKLVPWHSLSISAARSAIAAAELALYMKLRRHRFVWNRATVLGGAAMGVESILYILANKLTTAANAILIQYTAPVFILLFSWLLFRERPTKLDAGATVLLSAGIVLFFLDSVDGGGMPGILLGNALALFSGMAYALVFMMKRFDGADTLSSVLIGCGIGALAGLPWLAGERDFSGSVLLGVLLIGVIQFGLAYLCLAEGLTGTPPLMASLISMIEPVLNPILAALVLSEVPGPLSLVGAAIVVFGVIGYNLLQSRAAKDTGTAASPKS